MPQQTHPDNLYSRNEKLPFFDKSLNKMEHICNMDAQIIARINHIYNLTSKSLSALAVT
jgi:hypothetical protein